MLQKPVPIPINLGIQQACLFHLDAGQGDRGTPTGLAMVTFQSVEKNREENNIQTILQWNLPIYLISLYY